MFVTMHSMLAVGSLQIFRWDVSASGGIQDGGGTWGSSAFWTSDGGTTRGAWVSGAAAVFGGGTSGTASTVTVSGTQTADSITFNTPFAGTYSLTTGTIVLVGSAGMVMNSSVTVSAVIDGTAGMHVMGTGTLTLTGTNIYTGTTTIDSGATLKIGSGGTVGTIGAGAVVANGTLAFARTDATAISNDISGTGAISNASGTLTLTGANAYAGTTTISGGTVIVGSGTSGTLGTGAVAMSNSTNLRFGRTDAVTITNDISGGTSDTFQISNGGTVTYTGTSSVVGTMSFSANAVFEIGSGGTSGTWAGAISGAANACTVIFNRSDNVTFAQNITSSAGTTMTIFQKGAGKTTFSGTNSRMNWRVDAGIMSVATTSVTQTASGIIMNGGTLQYTSTTASVGAGITIGSGIVATVEVTTSGQTLTLTGGVPSTTGGLTKKGPGGLTLSTGTSNYTGTDRTEAGTLSSAGGTESATYFEILWDSAGASNTTTGLRILHATPAVGTKTFNVIATNTAAGAVAVVVLKPTSGTATGTPTLQWNGVTKTSGVPFSDGARTVTMTWSATLGLQITTI